MSYSPKNVRLLATTASFTRTVTKWTLNCDGSASKSNPNAIVRFAWVWGDGKNDTITNGTKIAYHTYAIAKAYTVTLTITDSTGKRDSDSNSVTIVGNLAPVASFTSTPTAYTVAANSTSTDDGIVSLYFWSWGDNTTNDTTASPSHTYNLAGTYTITLTVKD